MQPKNLSQGCHNGQISPNTFYIIIAVPQKWSQCKNETSQLTTGAQPYKLLLALGRAPAPKKHPSYTPKTQACSKRHLVNNINAVVIQQATQ